MIPGHWPKPSMWVEEYVEGLNHDLEAEFSSFTSEIEKSLTKMLKKSA